MGKTYNKKVLLMSARIFSNFLEIKQQHINQLHVFVSKNIPLSYKRCMIMSIEYKGVIVDFLL